MHRLIKILAALALAGLCLAALLWQGPEVNRRAETIVWAEPYLENIYVHGENAHFTLEPGFGEDVLLIGEKAETRRYYQPAVYINRGLYLPGLKSGLYRIYASDFSVLAPDGFELSGYTITRGGQNLHYRFCSEQGRLVLAVTAVTALPEEVFDLLIDAGHGGGDTGSTPGRRLEKNENLRASIYMAELFSSAGLKVALARDGDYAPGLPGRTEDDIDPYVEEGRVYSVYSKQVKYYISNHLNGGNRRGWQLYRSVQTDDGWQQAVSAAFIAYGHKPNDDFHGFGREGIYRRYSQDDEQTGRDYYFVLRETGGELTIPYKFAAAHPQMDLRQGAEGLLVEYVFLENIPDQKYWDENWQGLVEAVVKGCLHYWGIK